MKMNSDLVIKASTVQAGPFCTYEAIFLHLCCLFFWQGKILCGSFKTKRTGFGSGSDRHATLKRSSSGKAKDYVVLPRFCGLMPELNPHYV